MSNPIKNKFDKTSLIKDISERDRIISNYEKYGSLDRNEAIKKIQELRTKDKDIAAATAVNLAVSSTPFSQSTNGQIVGELVMQRDILQGKLIKIQAEENNEHKHLKTKA